MLFVMTVLAQRFKIRPVKRDVWIIDVATRQVDLVVNNLGKDYFSLLVTAFAQLPAGSQVSVTAGVPRIAGIEPFGPWLHWLTPTLSMAENKKRHTH